MKIKITQIRIDGNTQNRAEIDQGVVNEYAEAIIEGAKFPPVTLFHDGVDYWLADGFHRYHAHNKIEALDIDADVKNGTYRDARLFSFGVNALHGLRRSNADKRKAVVSMLGDEEWGQWSDRKIADACSVSHTFVASIRNPKIKNRQRKNRESSIKNKIKVESDSTFESSEVESDSTNHDFNGSEQIITELSHGITDLEEENKKLRDAIATQQLPDDIEIQTAEEIISELRTEVKNLNIKLQAVTDSRDSYMREVATLKDQCNRQAKQLKKMGIANNA